MDYKQFALSVHEAQNRLRKNPQSFIPILEARLKLFEGNLYKAPGKIPLRTNEGPAAVKECIEVLRKTKPLGELAFDPNLTKAGTDHVNDIGPKGITGHSGSDGSGPFDRIKRYGAFNCVAENIDFGSNNGEEVIISLIVDDGVSSRGHRTNMLKSDYDITGIACGYHQGYDHCTVIVYSNKGKGSGQNADFGKQTSFNKEFADLQNHFSKPFGDDFNAKKMNEMKVEMTSHVEKGVQIIKTSEKTAIRTVNGVTTKTVYKTVFYADGSKKEEVQEITEGGEASGKQSRNLVEEWKMEEAKKNEKVNEPVKEEKTSKKKSGGLKSFFLCGCGSSKSKKNKYEAKV